MSEAPKKIWVDDKWEAHPRGPLIATNDVTPYIREDIVLGLVDALEAIKQSVCGDKNPNWKDWDAVYFSRGRIANTVDAALKSLEEA